MPLTITSKTFGNLYVDFEYVVSNRDKLGEYNIPQNLDRCIS